MSSLGSTVTNAPFQMIVTQFVMDCHFERSREVNIKGKCMFSTSLELTFR